MNKKAAIILVVFLLGGGLFYYWYSERVKYDWREQYRPQADEPFDVSILYDLFEASGSSEFFEQRTQLGSLDSIEENTLFVHISRIFELDTSEIPSLLDYVCRGNHALIAARHISPAFMDSLARRNTGAELSPTGIVSSFNDTLAEVDIPSAGYSENFPYLIRQKSFDHNWRYFDTDSIGGKIKFETVALLNEKPLVLRIRFGKGSFLLQADPLVLTNFYMIKEEKFRYALHLMDHFPSPEEVHYDRRSFGEPATAYGPSGLNRSPLTYILSRRELQWAWYVLLGGVLVFLIFGSKRTKRAAPHPRERPNTSLEFYQALGDIYYRKGDHQKLSREIFRQFAEYIRKRYKLRVDEREKSWIPPLAMRAEVEEDIIRDVFFHFGRIKRQQQIDAEELKAFYKEIHSFYKNSK